MAPTRNRERLDPRLVSPSTVVLYGPTGCGKTRFMMKLIDDRASVCQEPPVEVLYCYGEWQPAFERDDVTFINGMIGEEDLPKDGQHRWLVIDDLMKEVSGKATTDNLFTKYSHHRNVTVFFLVQSFFRLRTESLLKTVTTYSCLKILETSKR